MGVFDVFNPKPVVPTVPSVLPEAAKRQLLQGQLPILRTNNLLLKNNENCHYADRAIFENRIVRKKRIRKNAGYSMPGLLRGTRIHIGGSDAEYVDHITYDTIKGILYITSKRIVFVGGTEGFDKKIDDLVAITPYANCIELQFSKEVLKLFVPNGNLVQMVLKLL